MIKIIDYINDWSISHENTQSTKYQQTNKHN